MHWVNWKKLRSAFTAQRTAWVCNKRRSEGFTVLSCMQNIEDAVNEMIFTIIYAWQLLDVQLAAV